MVWFLAAVGVVAVLFAIAMYVERAKEKAERREAKESAWKYLGRPAHITAPEMKTAPKIEVPQSGE